MAKIARPEPDNYLVAFYDILGNGDAIREWSDLAAWRNDNKRVSEAFWKTIKSISEIRSSFQNLAGGLNETEMSNELEHWRSQIDPSGLEIVDKIRLGRIRHQSFSDTNIWFVKITDNTIENFFYSKAMGSLLLGLSFCHLDALSKGLFCRGGLSLGVATDMGGLSNGDEIVGPALLDAYELESKRADSARIAVGDGLVMFLDSRTEALNTSRVQENDLSTRVAIDFETSYITDMRSMIIQDIDDQWILDYAGEKNAAGIRTVMERNGFDSSKFYSSLLDQVQHQIELNKKLEIPMHLKRAMALYTYLEERKNHWL